MSGNEQHHNALPVGFRLENYLIASILGHGGFGITYRAVDEDLRDTVAIKEYLPREVAYREQDATVSPLSESDRETFEWGLARFLDEARTLARFRHPNIVGVRRFLRANGTAYLVMDYCEGESLESLLAKDGSLPPERLVTMLVPLLGALEALHEAGVTHRDIKPGNIYLREDGSPVLLDFGAARQALAQHSRSVTAMATPGYGAFEQYSAKGKQGPWTDIYGLGATLYRCVAGKRPPDASDRMLEDDLVPAAQAASGRYPRPLLAQIDAALKMRPQDRPQSIGEWRKFASLDATDGVARGASDLTGWGVSQENFGLDHRASEHVPLAGMVSSAGLSGGWNAKNTGAYHSQSNHSNPDGVPQGGSSKPVFEEIFKFSGRRNRKSYALFQVALFSFGVLFLALLGGVVDGLDDSGAALFGIVSLLFFIPLSVASIAVATQRLRDTGFSGWWVVGLMLLHVIPYVGWLGYLLLFVVPGQEGSNQYGPDPLLSAST